MSALRSAPSYFLGPSWEVRIPSVVVVLAAPASAASADRKPRSPDVRRLGLGKGEGSRGGRSCRYLARSHDEELMQLKGPQTTSRRGRNYASL